MTRQTLNLGLLVRTGAALALLATLTHIAHGWQTRRHARGQLARADEAEAAGRLDEAVAALNRYLLFVPDDEAVRARYALTWAEIANNPRARWRALEGLRRVLAREPSRHDV